MQYRRALVIAALTLALPFAAGACASGPEPTPPPEEDLTAPTPPVTGVSPEDEAAVERLIKAEMPDLRVWIPLDDAAKAARVEPALKKGEKLAHAPLVGPIGPTDAAVLALVEVEGGPSRLAGFLLVPGDGGDRRVDLPELDASQLHQVEWVAFDNVDEDRAWEIVVRSTHMTGVGPEGAVPYDAVVVVDWDGEKTQRVADAEKALEGVVDPKQARVRLQRRSFETARKSGRFVGPCEMAVGDWVTRYSYDSYGRIVREEAGKELRVHRYDEAGLLVETTTTFEDSAPVVTRYTTDARGLVVVSRRVVDYGEDGGPMLVAGVNTYDARGRLVKEASIDASGANHVTYAWDGQRLVGSDHDYPDSDEFCSPTPPVKHEEDAQGRIIRQEFRDTPELCEGQRDETWRYDAAGNLVEHRVKSLDGNEDSVTTFDYGCWTKSVPDAPTP